MPLKSIDWLNEEPSANSILFYYADMPEFFSFTQVSASNLATEQGEKLRTIHQHCTANAASQWPQSAVSIPFSLGPKSRAKLRAGRREATLTWGFGSGCRCLQRLGIFLVGVWILCYLLDLYPLSFLLRFGRFLLLCCRLGLQLVILLWSLFCFQKEALNMLFVLEDKHAWR